jgi:hypothetical protein
MCLGETRNNQGDSFVYDGKISKSKRKLLEGGINVFTSSFLRAKHILFSNNPPNTPSDPSPVNHAPDQSIDVDLSWTGGDPDAGDTVTYDVYFGTSTSPPLVSNDQSGTTYEPGTLSYNTKYYWKIVATDNHGASTTGPLWDFKTGSAPNNPPNTPGNPSPVNHAPNQSIDVDLSWTGGDPDASDTVTYDVYYGTTTSPPLVSNDQSGTTYDPGTLSYDTKYYWKIVATDNHDASTTGALWDFATEQEQEYNVDLTVDYPSNITTPNVNATYVLTVTNTGTVMDSYMLSLNNIDNAAIAILNTSSVTNLPSGSSTTVLLNVTDETPGIYNVSVTTTSQGNSSVSDTIITKTTVREILPPQIVTYTITNRTITPPQTTEIYVGFSEEVAWIIAIEGSSVIYDWFGTSTNPAPKIWNGTYEVNGTIVPDGDYYVNVSGTNTTTGLSVINNTEIITVTTPDTTPPIISNVQATSITTSSATITWGTDEVSDSMVKYGTTSGIYTLTASEPANITSHSVSLTGLSANTTYYYVVNSTDPSANSAESEEYSFTTGTVPSGGIFDTGTGTYPSIMGTHIGTITPNQTITVSKLYTYPCTGTGGHTEYARIWNNSGLERIAKWGGYKGDWHNITFNETFVLYKNKTYNYTIRTGSYPQIIHKQNHTTLDDSLITCEEFIDANGKKCNDWIPAIKLFFS